jgi:branched-chain amino acid transport system permease protein
MGLGGAIQAHFIGFIAPENYRPALTFQVWAMLIVGGSGNNRGALAGALLVWALWALSGGVLASVFPPEHQARAAALQIVAIGVALAAILVVRPQGLFGELATVSRHVSGRRRSKSPARSRTGMTKRI